MTSLRGKNALPTQIPVEPMEGTFRQINSPVPQNRFSPTERRPSCPLSPGKAQRIFIIEENAFPIAAPPQVQDTHINIIQNDDPIVLVVPEEELPPKPFVRADYMRRSLSLPDIADIENNVMLNHEIDQNRNRLRTTFAPFKIVNGVEEPIAGGSQVQTRTPQTWFGGVFGCFRPIIGILGTKGFKDNKNNSWEIVYDDLRDMQYLGCGAQGSVYVATLNNEQVAVKKMRERCESEILNLRKLNHKNIVAFKGICSEPNNFCIVMEYCHNGQLCHFLKRCTSTETFLKPFQVVDWSRQIASGMAYLHKHMIIHRDLKSPNVLISDDFILKISDFGISRQMKDNQSTKMSFAGTAAWMAPEVIRMETSSTKVDVWSYGIVLWELLTLEMPYSDFEQSTIIYGIGNNALSLPLPTSLPPGYKLLMQLCWKPKPKNRPSFFHILTHIEIACREILDMTCDEFAEKQRIWKHDVKSRLSQARISFHNSNTNLHSHSSKGSREHAGEQKMNQESEQIRVQMEQCEEIAKNITLFYQNMFSVMANFAEREKKLCKAEMACYKKQVYQQGQMSSLFKQAVPVYKSALELSRQVSSSALDKQSVDDIDLEQINKYLESPIKKSSFIQSGSVKQRLRRNRRAKSSSHQSAMQANFAHEPSSSFGESLQTDPSFDHDVIVNEPSELEELGPSGTVPMMRNIPNRRTFDSGYGDSQSAVSSPIAELKKNDAFRESFNSQMSRDSSANGCRARCRLRRQKAMDRGSCPSSANSRSRSGGHRNSARRPSMANSSTDYEDNDEDYDSLSYPNNAHSMSTGRLEHVKNAYGRLRRKTSFNSSSSNDLQDDEEDECNTSSSNENIPTGHCHVHRKKTSTNSNKTKKFLDVEAFSSESQIRTMTLKAVIQNEYNICQEIFLEYVIVDTNRNGMALQTLAFDKSYQQEYMTLELDEDSEDSVEYTSPVRRSFSQPILMSSFRIEPLHEIKLEDLKYMKKIGFGSQSDIFVATHKNRKVAVKVMRHHFENEIENLRKLKHRNIVQFIGACTDDEKTFIVMEFCEKGRLFDYLQKPEEPITPPVVLEWSHQIASGMAYLHRHNVIHRDLKSPNILIDNDFRLRISDFGLSKPRLTNSLRMPFAGTISWMAPEVIKMEACSEKVDVWSYGVVLWEMLTLRIPFQEFEQTSIIFGIGSHKLRLPTPKSFPEPLRELMIQCWTVKPELRPSFKRILQCLNENGQKFAKIPMKKFAKLQIEWKDECGKL